MDKKIKTFSKKTFIIIGILIFFIFILMDPLSYIKATPPSNMTNIDSFLKWQTPRKIYYIENLRSKESYFLLCGIFVGWLPSGSSGYAFDSKGNYMGWTPDIGDNKTPHEVFDYGNTWKKIDIKEMKIILSKNNGNHQSQPDH